MPREKCIILCGYMCVNFVYHVTL